MEHSTEALRLGLVNAVFEDRAVVPAAARAVPRRIARDSAGAVSPAEAVLDGVRGRTVTEGPAVEPTAFRQAFTTADTRERTAAFLAKRPPAFALPLPRD
ncbi:hypothetical protein GCM10010492_65510 [Saccharothrix mutabilis subsp. mutabilis]|uniref:Enoyl-CoA hydratase n=1 Tax=Saccharothrix mutabilis subsp. mutabilis TaxID=66855 RepID=A0ABP3EBE6_9PSEU